MKLRKIWRAINRAFQIKGSRDFSTGEWFTSIRFFRWRWFWRSK